MTKKKPSVILALKRVVRGEKGFKESLYRDFNISEYHEIKNHLGELVFRGCEENAIDFFLAEVEKRKAPEASLKDIVNCYVEKESRRLTEGYVNAIEELMIKIIGCDLNSEICKLMLGKRGVGHEVFPQVDIVYKKYMAEMSTLLCFCKKVGIKPNNLLATVDNFNKWKRAANFSEPVTSQRNERPAFGSAKVRFDDTFRTSLNSIFF